MTDIEQKADDLVRSVYREILESARTPIVLDITGSARDLILAHDDEIRRECAEIAETIVSESLYDGAGYYQVDIPFMKSAIMKKD